MLETPQIVQSTAQPAAVIRLTVPRPQIEAVMGPALIELMGRVAAEGIGPAGPWFCRHLRLDPEVWDVEVGVPVTAPPSPGGRVVPGELPAARVLRAVYRGGYEGIGGAWMEFERWRQENLSDDGDGTFWEQYLTGPESGSDPAEYRTELNRPLQG